MDYEKAYNEAIERAKQFMSEHPTRAEADLMVALFPELKESEDERIRKELVEKISKLACGCFISQEQKQNFIAYLEKQKEQKTELPKPHKGDDTNPYDMSVSEAQEYAINRGFGIPFNDGEVYVDERHITQTIGNIIRWADEHPKEQKPAEWSAEDEKDVAHIIRVLDDCYAYGKHDLSKTDYENLVGTLKSLRPQSKKEWSEDDERRIEGIVQWLREYQEKFNPKYDSLSIESIESLITWLKSLRPSWKPSEEQSEVKCKTSLPSNIDEAAEDHIRKVVDAAGHPGWDWETQDIAEAFKSGAEWMAGQGVILNLSIDEFSCGVYNACVEQGLTSEDDVIVQIRKKQ